MRVGWSRQARDRRYNRILRRESTRVKDLSILPVLLESHGIKIILQDSWFVKFFSRLLPITTLKRSLIRKLIHPFSKASLGDRYRAPSQFKLANLFPQFSSLAILIGVDWQKKIKTCLKNCCILIGYIKICSGLLQIKMITSVQQRECRLIRVVGNIAIQTIPSSSL